MKEGDFKCMSDMHASHSHFPFPQDGTYTTFSSTCLYWRPKPELSTPLEDQLVDEASTVAPDSLAEKSSAEVSEQVTEEKARPELEVETSARPS